MIQKRFLLSGRFKEEKKQRKERKKKNEVLASKFVPDTIWGLGGSTIPVSKTAM